MAVMLYDFDKMHFWLEFRSPFHNEIFTVRNIWR